MQRPTIIAHNVAKVHDCVDRTCSRCEAPLKVSPATLLIAQGHGDPEFICLACFAQKASEYPEQIQVTRQQLIEIAGWMQRN